MSSDRVVENVTCLGCGCGCDDVTVSVSQNRIVNVTPVCSRGRAWFGDGGVPSEIRTDGQPASLEQALAQIAMTLRQAMGKCLVYLGRDLTSEAQRAAITIADLLRATVDGTTSDTAANGLITAQRRGRAGATLGEIRNRGDVFLFWGVDPQERYPRFLARYGPEPVGSHVPEGRGGRFVISVSVGGDGSLGGADLAITVPLDDEITALTLMRASVLGQELPATPLARQSAEIAGRLVRARYAVLLHDAEPTSEQRNPLRAEALIALSQSLNGPTRAALCSLRDGGNVVGAESALTSQTGYPLAVDYSAGYPRYRPDRRGIAGVLSGTFRAALIIGSPPLDDSMRDAFSSLTPAIIGPRATEAPFTTSVAIDTGVAGIHEEGVGYRMDEVPLSLRPSINGPRPTVDVLHALTRAIQAELPARAR